MATPHDLPDNFIRVLQALQYICDKALPSLEAVIKSWQTSQSIQSCNSHTCPTEGKKPKQHSSCPYCVQWGKAVEHVYYPQPQATSKGAVSISWKNVDPTLLGRDPVEVANAFALHLPQAQRPSKFQDYDTASILKIMLGFGEYHRNNAAVGQFNDPYNTIKTRTKLPFYLLKNLERHAMTPGNSAYEVMEVPD